MEGKESVMVISIINNGRLLIFTVKILLILFRYSEDTITNYGLA